VDLIVIDEAHAAAQREAVAGQGYRVEERVRRDDLQLAAIAVGMALAVVERVRPGADVGGDDADVIRGRMRRARRLQRLDEEGDPVA